MIFDASKLNIFTNTIGFSTFHKFRDNEQVIYLSDGQTGVAGLTTDAKYYVSVIDALNIKLHKTEGDSISGINTITITDYGVGIHRFKSVEKKSIISNIIVSNSGEGYTNKQRTTTSSNRGCVCSVLTSFDMFFLFVLRCVKRKRAHNNAKHSSNELKPEQHQLRVELA